MIGKTDLRLTRQEKIIRPETDDIKIRLKKVETQEPIGSFSKPVISPWLDYPLDDLTYGSHLTDNTPTYPTDWTQSDAPQTTATNDEYSFWSIVGAAGETSWKYRKQTPYTISSLTANAYKSFHVGPIIIKESLPTADLNYYFGIYRDSGGIDENTFIRININWSSASSIWQIRAERKDGTTQTNGTYYTLARLPVAPLWVRVTARNSTNRDVFGYFGAVRFPVMQMQLMNATLGSGITWGQVWLQFHMSRGAGPDDRIMIGGYDYSDDA